MTQQKPKPTLLKWPSEDESRNAAEVFDKENSKNAWTGDMFVDADYWHACYRHLTPIHQYIVSDLEAENSRLKKSFIVNLQSEQLSKVGVDSFYKILLNKEIENMRFRYEIWDIITSLDFVVERLKMVPMDSDVNLETAQSKIEEIIGKHRAQAALGVKE